MSSAYVDDRIVYSGKLSHYSAIWQDFGALLFLLEPKEGTGGHQSCVGLFYYECSKVRTIKYCKMYADFCTLS
jgi:hypothetical protein